MGTCDLSCGGYHAAQPAKQTTASGFVRGRFPDGPSTVLRLTDEQKAFLDLAWRCRSNRNNQRTPYIFTLTPKQSGTLRKEAGFSPTRFAILESFKGDTEADEDVNIINRFSEDEFEIPHKLLTHDREAHNWEVDIMGWLPNPLEKLDPKDVKPGTCP